MQDILINWSPQETRVAMVENGAVQEFHLERALERGLVGNIYCARVVRVLPGMQSAFIDIGLERTAFLHVADLQQPAASASPLQSPEQNNAHISALPIERLLFAGQSLTVQVVKEPMGTKGARLSGQISIAGRLLVYLPRDDHIGISQKIDSAELRTQLRERVTRLAKTPDATGSTPDGGFILRTNAEDATDDELAEDIAYLRKTWSAVQERSFKLASPALLHRDLNLAQRVLRDFVNQDTQSVRIDSRLQFESLCEFGQEFAPSSVVKLTHYSGERPIFDLYNIDEELARALNRRVDLKSGGYLIIDQTEALTTVDVNTGSFVGARNFDDTIFKTNLEAGQSIARQLRLRNLGGIVIIDFIDMTRPEHQEAVLLELRKQLAKDRTKVSVSGFTQLGLVEMTRKRTRESLAHLLCQVCHLCQGRGQLKTARSVCYEIMREILREARQFNPKEFRIIACAPVVEMLLDEESQHLAGLSEFIGKPISLQTENAGSLEHYDIVLL
jgi:ribonuclease G